MYAQQDRNDKVGGTPGTAKYVRFYSQWLPKVSPELFGGDSPPPGRFADLGASPGGLCEYLVGRLGWTGQAFSKNSGPSVTDVTTILSFYLNRAACI